MSHEATNVDHKSTAVEACLATMKAKERELEPSVSARIVIREHLKNNPVVIKKAEQNTKAHWDKIGEAKGFEPGE